jgi:hypothetical protein
MFKQTKSTVKTNTKCKKKNRQLKNKKANAYNVTGNVNFFKVCQHSIVFSYNCVQFKKGGVMLKNSIFFKNLSCLIYSGCFSYWLDNWYSIPSRTRRFSTYHHARTGSGPTLSDRFWGQFLGLKRRIVTPNSHFHLVPKLWVLAITPVSFHEPS